MTEERKKELARAFIENATDDVDGDVWELVCTVAAEERNEVIEEMKEQARLREVDVWQLEARVKELEDELFKHGAMKKAPCFVCGYNGRNYYHPERHPCAERHHRLLKEAGDD
jgi:hypothetical protein